MKFDRKDIPDLADDYVLGLLDALEAEAIEAALVHDDALRAAVSRSRERFLPLDTTVEPAAIKDDLWEKIETRLLPQTGAAYATSPKTANDNRSNSWRGIALSAIAASFLLAAGLAFSLTRPIDPLVIAVLLDENGQVKAVVEDFGNEKATVRMLADFAVPRDKTIQLWTLPSKEVGPVSLGLIEGVRSAKLEGPALPAPRSDQLYEITLEQAGGSPTGRPTGPILAKGFARMPR
ncbi:MULTISPECIES: anti-sigma factor [Agrobacterium]|uniref:Anti-sigma factor n=1 Tax=Agrobacterium salinitolerans TaxID=1183413 RepID=A0A1S9EP36_9HYPH|nr:MULTISPECIES: anti-sigma factor [Agrobacterium]PNQ23381.1 anti-sigma factor [Rhizobium sp. YIC5082]MCZ7853561.1 anti-sigma factor [Agrobacterium salinitolerans]MCZ7859104.1 anti-sigma factor [Agrobacterium salinitolerans]MCZ7886381.1 anti-sigma factor [Agrobacterium salinitolerans]MCZ7940770.1 anti-sigma factor [Agrobacterium salinitolerans]